MTEVPNEVCLTLQIGACPYRCEGCHSPQLREEKGFSLVDNLNKILQITHGAFTTVCFMGEGNDLPSLIFCMRFFQQKGYKIALYTGCDGQAIAKQIENFGLTLDFYKYGAYNKEKGGLDALTTNQHFFARHEEKQIDITHLFQKRKKQEIGEDFMRVRSA